MRGWQKAGNAENEICLNDFMYLVCVNSVYITYKYTTYCKIADFPIGNHYRNKIAKKRIQKGRLVSLDGKQISNQIVISAQIHFLSQTGTGNSNTIVGLKSHAGNFFGRHIQP